MAIAVDASSPARAISTLNTGNVTTGAFNPPDQSILVGLTGHDNGGADPGPSLTVTNNGTALAWNHFILRNIADSGAQNGAVAAAWAYLPTARTGMTVTFTSSNAIQDITGKLYVLTGADPVKPIGGTAEGSTTTASITTDPFTSQSPNSLGFVASNDYNVSGAPSSTGATIDAYSVASQFSGMSGYKTLATGNTFTITSPSAPLNNWITFEVLPFTAWPRRSDRPVKRARLC